jgi:hypothetical protein
LDGGGGTAVQPHHLPFVTVIVHKDENGYGMKVSGDKPVYVQSVKEGKSVFAASCLNLEVAVLSGMLTKRETRLENSTDRLL